MHYKDSNFLLLYYRSSYITNEHKKIAEKLKKPVLDILKIGIEEGLIKSDVDPNLLFLAIVGFAREIADEFVNKSDSFTDNVIDETFTIIWDMIKS
jgi:hypothetical protein